MSLKPSGPTPLELLADVGTMQAESLARLAEESFAVTRQLNALTREVEARGHDIAHGLACLSGAIASHAAATRPRKRWPEGWSEDRVVASIDSLIDRLELLERRCEGQ